MKIKLSLLLLVLFLLVISVPTTSPSKKYSIQVTVPPIKRKCEASSNIEDTQYASSIVNWTDGCGRAWWHGYFPEPEGVVVYNTLAWSPAHLPPYTTHKNVSATRKSHILLLLNECNLDTQCNEDPWTAAAFTINEALPQSRSVSNDLGIEEKLIVGNVTMDACGRDWMSEYVREVKRLNGGTLPREIVGFGWHLYPDITFQNWREDPVTLCEDQVSDNWWDWRIQTDAVRSWAYREGVEGYSFWLTEWGLQFNHGGNNEIFLEDVLAYLNGEGLWWSKAFYYTGYRPDGHKSWRYLVEGDYVTLTNLGVVHAAASLSPPESLPPATDLYLPLMRTDPDPYP